MQASFSGRTASILKCERTIRWRPLLNTPKAIQSKSNVSTIIREGAIQPALQSGESSVARHSLLGASYPLSDAMIHRQKRSKIP